MAAGVSLISSLTQCQSVYYTHSTIPCMVQIVGYGHSRQPHTMKNTFTGSAYVTNTPLGAHCNAHDAHQVGRDTRNARETDTEVCPNIMLVVVTTQQPTHLVHIHTVNMRVFPGSPRHLSHHTQSHTVTHCIYDTTISRVYLQLLCTCVHKAQRK